MGQMPQQPVVQPQAFNIDFNSLFETNKPAGSKALLDAIGVQRKATVFALVFVDFLPQNPMITGEVAFHLDSLISGISRVPKLDLVLRSTGGFAEIPWRIVSVLRSFCEELEVVVPRAAMSGATHIAIAADNLVMSPLSALGSVDPTRNHPLLPRDPQTGHPTPASVQDLRHCLAFLKKNVPQKNQLGQLVGQLFSHVHPLAIGAIEQSYELSRMITEKVLGTRRKKLSAKHVAAIAERLAGEYFSHGYPISRSEVEEELRLPMTKANPGGPLFGAMEALNSYYNGVFEKQTAVAGPIPLSFRVTGFLETATKRKIYCQVFGPNGQPLAAAWMSEANS